MISLKRFFFFLITILRIKIGITDFYLVQNYKRRNIIPYNNKTKRKTILKIFQSYIIRNFKDLSQSVIFYLGSRYCFRTTRCLGST